MLLHLSCSRQWTSDRWLHRVVLFIGEPVCVNCRYVQLYGTYKNLSWILTYSNSVEKKDLFKSSFATCWQVIYIFKATHFWNITCHRWFIVKKYYKLAAHIPSCHCLKAGVHCCIFSFIWMPPNLVLLLTTYKWFWTNSQRIFFVEEYLKTKSFDCKVV